ncbi:MAG: Terminase-like family protein [Ruminococcaceae bacterium]|nr:Terminase-like family protein [Oscillospiraceae bacterium]
MNVIWTPQKKQEIFQSRPEYEALYGGAAGGGKSDALLTEALRQVHIPHYRGLILRKTYPQLSELIDRSRELYSKAFPTAKYNETKHVWVFQSGAKIYFGAMQHTSDRINYQGKRYDFIAFDELTHFTWDEYSYMFSRNRPSGKGTRVYIRSTTNPGGIGHGWVKERFITAAPPLTPIETKMQIAGPDGKLREVTRDRIFVPSTVFDNQRLLENDPGYIANLSMLPHKERQALLYGDWDSFSGQVFTEWKNDPAHYKDRCFTHVIAPFEIPKTWKIYRGFDFGYSKPYATEWIATDHDGRVYVIAELYGCTDTPDTGVKDTPMEIARKIRQIEESHPNLKGRKIIGIADPAIAKAETGQSISDMMAKEGVFFDFGDHQRLPGKMQFHYRFAFDENGIPMMYVFSNCRHFIRTIPNLIYDDSNVEDINTKSEDHIYDCVRYVLMANPISPRKNSLSEIKDSEDPLDLHCDNLSRYSFFEF